VEKLALRKAKIIVGIFLFVHVIFIFWQPGYMWGIDFLAYYSPWQDIGVGILSIAIFLLPKHANTLLHQIALCTSGIRFIGFLIFASTCFIVFQTPTHLLGDGALFLRELATLSDHQAWSRPNRSPIVYALIENLYHQLHITPLLVYQIYSWASGFLYLCTAVIFSKKIGQNKTETALLLCALLSSGIVIQFFGYVENYALLFPVILAFLLLGLLTLQNKCHIFIFSAFTGVLFPIHFLTFSFLPAFCIVIYLAISKSQVSKLSTYLIKSAFCLFITASIATVLFTIVHFNFLSYLQEPKPAHLLSLFDFKTAYGFFSLPHILDIINLLLLISPFALMVLCFLLPQFKFTLSHTHLFLMSATFFPIGMVAVANPEIGFFRDWDAFSFVAIPFTIWLFFLLRDHCANTNILAQVGILFIAGAWMHTTLWIGINTSEMRSRQRFEAILHSKTVPPVAAAFSWETLGIYYRQQNEPDLAQKAYENALKNDPHNARYLNGLAIFYHKKNDTKRALQYFKQALDKNPKLPAVQANIGDIFFQHNQYDSAKYYYEQALKNGLSDVQLYHNLGNTYQALGDTEQAKKWFGRSSPIFS
jgi:hypothetical protein